MKKKKTITLIAACMALFAGTQTVLAQNGVLLPENQVDTRRGDAGAAGSIGYINSANNVNSEFGAGETSTISNGLFIFPSNSNNVTDNNPNPNDIQIGSDFSKNVVINSYNSGGKAYGWLNIQAYDKLGGAFSSSGFVGKDSLNIPISLGNGVLAKAQSGTHTATTSRITGGDSKTVNLGERDNKFYLLFYHHGSRWYNSLGDDGLGSSFSQGAGDWADGYNWYFYTSFDILNKDIDPYTTKKSSTIDDEVPLEQFSGDNLRYTDNSATPYFGNVKKTEDSLFNYKRPTTVAIQGPNNTYNQIIFKDLRWYYRTYEAKTTNGGTESQNWTCGHGEGNGLGKMEVTETKPYWDKNDVVGGTFLDAAVQLLNDARVCVKENVIDQTSNAATVATDPATNIVDTTRTDALLVFPNAERFTLRVIGNIDGINMKHWDGGSNAYFTQKNAVTTNNFPNPDINIYLYKGQNNHDFSTNYSLKAYTPVIYETIDAPYKTTASSILGVYGDYKKIENNAEIYTTATGPTTSAFTNGTDGRDANEGVIEVGPNTKGAKYFHILSGGMVKNFETCFGNISNFTLNFINDEQTPAFIIDESTKPLYIVNFGNNESENPCAAGINFAEKGIDKLVAATTDSCYSDGALQVQARGDVNFLDLYDPDVTKHVNQIRLLSDEAAVKFQNGLTYKSDKDGAPFTIWAKGTNVGTRSCDDKDNTVTNACPGYILFNAATSITHDGNSGTLVRSENDDVIMNDDFTYTNSTTASGNGDLIMQAGQDIYGSALGKNISFTQAGNKNILLEAKHTIHAKQIVTFTKDKATSANSGDFILKAGYKNFSDNSTPTTWENGDCRSLYDDVIKTYNNREECMDTKGGDIWFEGPVVVNIKAKADDNTTSTLLRAYNSVFIDDALTYTQETKKGGNARIFAHTGNIEAIKNDGTIVLYDIKNADNTGEIRLQAGNVPAGTTDDPNICESNNPCSLNEWNGNILFNKTFNITNKGKGYTEISAERDIETQIKGVANFTYDNASAGDFKMTAGRHIETHASMIYKYTNAPASNITMEAGRGDCTYNACEAIEEVGSNLTKDGDATLAYDPSGTYVNTFSEGGFGNGSILMFAPVKFDYDGSGLIYMKAVNGNIESDPYLHPANGGYGTGSLLSFDHKGKGVTKMQAIDIRLHDKINYNANSTDIENGQFYMLAYDSIITRDLTYTNTQDTGSIYIITNKYKSDCNSTQQGHIVLGYGADCTAPASNDNITFDFTGNTNTTGANVHILAGFAGFNYHTLKKDRFGGNITFDYIKATMAVGSHAKSGYMEMKTPNGNIWGKDSITFFGQEGDLLVDAGMGSEEDPDAEAWVNGENGATTTTYGMNTNILNTSIPIVCSSGNEWRTGNIMMKGGSLNFSGNATGNATFRTRHGYIDTYDAFNVYGMKGQLLKYAHDDNDVKQWGDVSERDFSYAPADGSVYFGADDNIMMNYGNSNGYQKYTNDGPCQFQGSYDCSNNILVETKKNPYYNTTYGTVTNYAKFNVNTNGYQWYVDKNWETEWHKLYRGGSKSCNKSGIAGTCATPSNGARDLTLPFTGHEGGFAAVANNYIDFFTKVIYNGGSGMGMATPTVGTIIGENVQGYGLYIKSRNQGDYPEKRRITCEDCGTEWPVVTFHDDARIHAENQKVNLEGPVIEFFGHAELDAQLNKGSKTNLVVKGDSLIFHDSAIFDGSDIKLLPFTTEGRGMRHGIVNDVNIDFYKGAYRQAITMTDRMLPVLELGYQRCNEPLSSPNKAPNKRSGIGKEDVPTVGGDVIVAVKDGYKLPIFNTVVANHARISFVSDSLDNKKGGEYLNAFVRTDLLRIRNKVEFYTGEGTGNNEPKNRIGHFELVSTDRMEESTFDKSGMYPKHLHMEPGSELSIPGENTLTAIATTTIGGYGEIHEDVYIKANGTIAPGHSSLMEQDCTSGRNPGMLKVHNLVMDKDAEFRISLGDQTGSNTTGVDTLYVEDTVRFNGKIPLYVLTDVKSVETGCYTFLIYNDKDGVSKEYVKNFTLMIDRYEDNYFSLNYSTPGEVKLCVSKSPTPVVQHYVELPVVEGVTLAPYTGGKHYVTGQQNFTFYATYTGAPLKVMGDGVYDGKHVEILGEKQSDGSYKYVLSYVVEPWTITIGPEFATNFVGNEAIEGNKVWAYKNMLYVNVSESDIASIYTMTGVLYKRVELPEGNSKFTLDKGMYIVTLKDGSVHKIVIK